MKKKPYQAPAVRKVRLVIKTSILANCHSSPNLDPKGVSACSAATGCYSPT